MPGPELEQTVKAVYPYNSNYDSFYWVEKFGDPGFQKHLAMAQLWGVLAVRMACVKVAPFKAAESNNTPFKF